MKILPIVILSVAVSACGPVAPTTESASNAPKIDKVKATDFMFWAYTEYVQPPEDLKPIWCEHKVNQGTNLVFCQYGQYQSEPTLHHKGLWEVVPTDTEFGMKFLAVNGTAREALAKMPDDPLVGEVSMPVEMDIHAALQVFE